MFYTHNLIVLVVCCAILCFRQVQLSAPPISAVDLVDRTLRAAALGIIRSYLVVFVFVWGADWLQGPHIFALYKDEKGFSGSMVALFFVGGFIAAGVSAVGVGTLADRLGRKYMCMLFCGTYTLSCLATALCESPLYLLIGRALGGFSTSILYSAFESWMVTEWTTKALGGSGISLSYLFGILTQANSVTAIVAGVVSELLVEKSGTLKSPFLAACALLLLAACIIGSTWTENYGDSSENNPWSDMWSAFTGLGKDCRVSSLAMASCVFEGSMYLFVFFWTPSLQDARASVSSYRVESVLPYGLIFSCFMASMMLGSLIFNHIINSGRLTQAQLLVYAFIMSAVSFTTNVYFAKHEWVVFWMWCIFEVCVGIYYPCMGFLKGTMVGDGKRAATYALMRLPLNIFVVGALGITGTSSNTGSSFRGNVFAVCAALLAAGALLIAYYIR